AAANSTIGGTPGTPVFSSDTAKATLAAGLAKGAAKSYLAAGAAVAGVLRTESNVPANAAGISATAIKANSKAATAIAQQVSALQAQTLKIANTVATNVDIERVGDVAKAVGSLLGQAGFPKATSFGSLATALGKAINAKPLKDRNDPLTANAGWHNRVDELG